MANPVDIQYAVISEVTAGTTPATPAFKVFPHVVGDNLQIDSEMIESPILLPNRTKATPVKAGYSASGELKTHMARNDAVDIMLESLVGGTFTSNVLKGGTAIKSMTVEKRFTHGATTHYQRFLGVQVSNMNLSVESKGIADLSFGLTGMGAGAPATTIITGATYPASVSNGKKLTGLDVSNVSVAGITGIFNSLELSVETNREAFHGFGSANALGVDMNGARDITLTLKLYRENLTPESTLLNDTAFAVSFTIGSGASGYTVLLPACVSETPKSEDDGVSSFVTLVLKAGYDATEATDIKITRLT